MPRALFFPSYRGGGFGHIARCLAVAQELRRRGWEAGFVLGGHHAQRLKVLGYRVFDPEPPIARLKRLFLLRARHRRAGPVYTVITDPGLQIIRDGLVSPRAIRRRIETDRRLVVGYAPHVLIGDTWPLLSAVGRLTARPVAQILQSNLHPAGPGLMWWASPVRELLTPDVAAVINVVLNQYGLPSIERAADSLMGDANLVPSIPELDPLPVGVPDVQYVGALLPEESAQAPLPEWLDDFRGGRPLVYVTVGGGAAALAGRQLFSLVVEAFADADWRILVSTSPQFSPEDVVPSPSNIRFETWVPGREVIRRSDLVVFHGGYSTMMETVADGVPSVVIPFHTEQECNGRRLAENGVAQVLPYSQGPFEVLHRRWAGGEYHLMAAWEPTLTACSLQRAVAEGLQRDEFRSNVLKLRARLADYGGALRAADLLEGMIDNAWID